MSLNWSFKDDFYGIMIRKSICNKETYTDQYNLYDGNALMVACYETNNTYRVCHFFASKDHMKNCLGLTKGYENIHEDEEITLILKPSSKSAKTIAETFVKAKSNKPLTIRFTEDINPIDSSTPFDIFSIN